MGGEMDRRNTSWTGKEKSYNPWNFCIVVDLRWFFLFLLWICMGVD
jgi:hypothetical protein